MLHHRTPLPRHGPSHNQQHLHVPNEHPDPMTSPSCLPFLPPLQPVLHHCGQGERQNLRDSDRHRHGLSVWPWPSVCYRLHLSGHHHVAQGPQSRIKFLGTAGTERASTQVKNEFPPRRPWCWVWFLQRSCRIYTRRPSHNHPALERMGRERREEERAREARAAPAV